MQAFATFLRDLFQNLIGAFVAREVSRVAAVTAGLAALLGFIAALAAAFFVAIQTALQQVVYTIQTPELAMWIGVFWPPHYSACLSIILSARVARWVYDRTADAAQTYWSALHR